MEINTNEMTPRAMTAAALSGQIDRKDLDTADRILVIEALRRRLDQAEQETILQGRRSGESWAWIGEIYGITRQAAQQRFRTIAALDEI